MSKTESPLQNSEELLSYAYPVTLLPSFFYNTGIFIKPRQDDEDKQTLPLSGYFPISLRKKHVYYELLFIDDDRVITLH